MDFIKKNLKNILLIVFAVIIVCLLMSTTCTSRRLNVANNNITALTDTISTYKLKNGALMYEKQGFILEKQELEKYLDISKKEVKELEKKLSASIATISKLQTQIHVDTIRTHDSIYITSDSVFHNKFNYQDQWLYLKGNTDFTFSPLSSSTTIDEISINASLKIGTSEDNKWFATCDNPYLQFTSIEGANLEKAKQKRWGFGPTVTAGVGYGWGTDFKGGNCSGGLIAGFMVGISLHYDIWQW